MRTDLGTRAITIQTFEKLAKSWLEIAKYRECALVINPSGDYFFNVPQLLDNKILLKKLIGLKLDKYIFLILELSFHSDLNLFKEILTQTLRQKKIHLKNIESMRVENVIDVLEKKGFKLVVFLFNLETLFESNVIMLKKLQEIYRNHNISFIGFSRINLTNNKFERIEKDVPSFFQNIILQKIHNKIDTHYFISYLEKLWSIKVPNKLRSEVIKNCGGYFWIVKQAVRHFRDNKNASFEEIFHHKNILQKTAIIWNRILPDEQKVIIKIKNKLDLSTKELNTLDYLYEIGFIFKKDSGDNEFTAPLIHSVIEDYQEIKKLLVKTGFIYLDGQLISPGLSKQEETVLKLFISKPNQMISREEIGSVIWKNNPDNYSEWALDRLIFRLRRKLKSFGLSKNIIFTKKGYGYVFKN